ncbi:MAG: ester cyclase [Burkholderiales bacterium]
MTLPVIVPYGQPGFMQAYTNVWSCGDGNQIGNYFEEDGQYIESSYGDVYDGRAGASKFCRFMFAFSKDSRIDYTSHCGNADGFALEWIWSGTATGPIFINGKVYPPTQKRYAVPGVAICRAGKNGLMALHRDYYDILTLMRQIGIVEDARATPTPSR